MNVQYIRSGDYFIPDLKLQDESRPIGKWGRMHRNCLEEHHPIRFNNLVLSGKLWTYLADLNEQTPPRMETLFVQMQSTGGYHRSIESCRSNGLDPTHEQHLRQSRGNYPGGVDLQWIISPSG